MPCHPARARTLLERGRARVARLAPFTIRLIDRTLAESEVDGVQLRIDPGSKATGIALTDEKQEVRLGGPPVTVRRGLVSVELRHRGAQIRTKMHRRATLRQDSHPGRAVCRGAGRSRLYRPPPRTAMCRRQPRPWHLPAHADRRPRLPPAATATRQAPLRIHYR
ncbi:RRXRR domain-containing protein [Streptomyces sp. MZ04]|uniref:RRXRR domain-containing protein n=1 Tax=Streptomyces sp. MZ04 TaxID=2559236 RepID=UPI001FD85F2E|nr:RRXRR domain-containing protein [Streptomyces sp. MZ04]